MTVEELIDYLDLTPHSEGGYYARTWTARNASGNQTLATNIYVLFRKGEQSSWYRKRSHSLWHHYCGGPLQVTWSETEAGPRQVSILGTDFQAGERPQLPIGADVWQKTECLGEYCLAGVTVAPGFRFEDYVLADPGFDIA